MFMVTLEIIDISFGIKKKSELQIAYQIVKSTINWKKLHTYEI